MINKNNIGNINDNNNNNIVTMVIILITIYIIVQRGHTKIIQAKFS